MTKVIVPAVIAMVALFLFIYFNGGTAKMCLANLCLEGKK